MTSLLDQARFATSENVLAKTRQAIIATAIQVASEASSGKAELDHSRLALAGAVLRDPTSWAKLFVYGLVSQDQLRSNSSDEIWLQVVSSLWNAYAGINPNLS